MSDGPMKRKLEEPSRRRTCLIASSIRSQVAIVAAGAGVDQVDNAPDDLQRDWGEQSGGVGTSAQEDGNRQPPVCGGGVFEVSAFPDRWESACEPACLTHLPTSVVRKVVIEFNIAAATGRILVEEAEFLPQFPMFCLSAYNALRRS
ncbi:hypothetical protein NM208_g11473 [Fusarium decemcellulare]|uniref:Uncharacterized protein n=1 Tax=Fusarium decemcellulare TaxID=57161 RepID=A0ACC1RUF4_9HYPO|nr:hypothetical protein NM208_g11473 [Fusarium decemcellulare]